jgi:hypothetical protein
MRTEISKLEFSLAAAFVLPAIAYVIGATWNKLVGSALQVGSDSQINKAWATFCLLGPIICIGMIVKLGFETIRSVWVESPFAASAAYLFFGVVVPTGLIYLIVRLWRPRHRHQRYPD